MPIFNHANQADVAVFYEIFKKLTVVFFNDQPMGSGTFIENSEGKVVCLTAKHVALPFCLYENVQMTLDCGFDVENPKNKSNRKKILVEKVICDHKYDLAILHFSESLPAETDFFRHKDILCSEPKIIEGLKTPCYFAGFPGDSFKLEQKKASGIAQKIQDLSCVDPRTEEISFNIKYPNEGESFTMAELPEGIRQIAGCSGGPLVSEKVKLIGVNKAQKLKEGDEATDLYFTNLLYSIVSRNNRAVDHSELELKELEIELVDVDSQKALGSATLSYRILESEGEDITLWLEKLSSENIEVVLNRRYVDCQEAGTRAFYEGICFEIHNVLFSHVRGSGQYRINPILSFK